MAEARAQTLAAELDARTRDVEAAAENATRLELEVQLAHSREGELDQGHGDLAAKLQSIVEAMV